MIRLRAGREFGDTFDGYWQAQRPLGVKRPPPRCRDVVEPLFDPTRYGHRCLQKTAVRLGELGTAATTKLLEYWGPGDPLTVREREQRAG